MGTISIEQAELTLCVFKQHQVLAKNAYCFDRANPHFGIKGRIELID